MQGPTAARMRSRRAPSFSIAAIVASTTPPSAPFQPACAAPITPAAASASSTGAQSAAITPSTTPGRSVTSPSALGAPGEVQRCVPTVSDLGRMDLVQGQELGLGVAEGLRHAPAVLAHVVGTVARAVAAIERRIEAGADAAAAGEEAVRARRRDRQAREPIMSASEKPAGAALLPSPTARTRNKVPI